MKNHWPSRGTIAPVSARFSFFKSTMIDPSGAPASGCASFATSSSGIAASLSWPRQRFTFSTVPPVALGKTLTITSAFAPPFSGTENFACCIGPGGTSVQPAGSSPGQPFASGAGAGALPSESFTVFRNSKNAGFCTVTAASGPWILKNKLPSGRCMNATTKRAGFSLFSSANSNIMPFAPAIGTSLRSFAASASSSGSCLRTCRHMLTRIVSFPSMEVSAVIATDASPAAKRPTFAASAPASFQPAGNVHVSAGRHTFSSARAGGFFP